MILIPPPAVEPEHVVRMRAEVAEAVLPVLAKIIARHVIEEEIRKIRDEREWERNR